MGVKVKENEANLKKPLKNDPYNRAFFLAYFHVILEIYLYSFSIY